MTKKHKPIYEALDDSKNIIKATKLAKKSDVVILVLGTNLEIANEAADRSNLNLPGDQLKLAQEVFKANPNTIAVLINGMPLTINWLDENLPAIVEAWYPGQAGGTAIAEALFGKYSPGGKLPVTFHKTLDKLPHIGEYDITKGHSYWFYKDEVLYPFGHGLSYTTFEYSNLTLNKTIFVEQEEIALSVKIANTGKMKGDEVVQVYVRDVASSVIQPLKKLRKFKRITLNTSESKTVEFKLNKEDFSYWNENKKGWIVEAGEFEILVGSSSTDIKLKQTVTIQAQ